MKIIDVVYGEFEINEQVLVELINSKALQRLKKIQQYGFPQEYYIFPGYTRYDHSLGVMIILKKVGASLEEQVAGLIHDVSHTAFSHVIDWVYGSGEVEDYQDKVHKQIISNSDIPKILSRFKIDWKKVSHVEDYHLLEKEIPDLCVDRIDYALREIYCWVDQEFPKKALNDLMVFDGKIVFGSKDLAKEFGINFLKLQSEHWGEADTVLRYRLFADLLKDALGKGIIIEDDFLKDDEYVMEKIKSSKDEKIMKELEMFVGKLKFEINDKNPSIRLKNKFRYVDPKFLDNEEVMKLSKVDKKYKKLIEKHRKENEKGVNVNF